MFKAGKKTLEMLSYSGLTMRRLGISVLCCNHYWAYKRSCADDTQTQGNNSVLKISPPLLTPCSIRLLLRWLGLYVRRWLAWLSTVIYSYALSGMATISVILLVVADVHASDATEEPLDPLSYWVWEGNRQEGQGSPNGGNSLQVSDIFISLKQQEETN